MATLLPDTSHTFEEFLLIPGLTRRIHVPTSISLATILTREKGGTQIHLEIPFASAVMQAVTDDRLAIALGRLGGIGCIFQSQSPEKQAEMVQKVQKQGILVGAGINTRDYRERVGRLLDAGANVLVIDASDGFSEWQADTIQYIQSLGTNIPVIAGNIVHPSAFQFLVDAGADAIKVGIGGGQICITRLQKAIGRGQASALMDVAQARDAYFAKTGIYIPLISDGGATEDYHNILALAMGADVMMHGRLFAACDESPAPKRVIDGDKFADYWGEGSKRAREQGNAFRYSDDTFEEGVDSRIPATGPLVGVIKRITAKIRATMASCGASTIREFHEKSVLTCISQASFREGKTEHVRVKN